ncbi:MAG: M20/M25/M40 family metallo-hydrolase [Flavobacteriales bacterium]
MRKFAFLLTIFISFGLSAQQKSPFQEKNIKKHITYLADDKLEGRGTGSSGEIIAAEYIYGQFKKLKLIPKGDSGRYHYKFNFIHNPDPKDTTGSKKEQRSGHNMVGYLDNGAEYTIVIGAHYDHLGLGHDHNSLDANPTGKIHNGADDNASGTAGVIELARILSTNKIKEKYNFLFMCFSGEELGLYGSKKYCENPTIDLTTVTCMINMDMIGRLNDTTKKIIVYGVGTAPDFVPLLDGIKSDLVIKKDSSGVGPSDQTSFYLKNIPVLHFFTGQHSDYHKPSDDVEKVNFKGEVMVLDYILQTIYEIDKLPKLKFLQTKTTMVNTGKRKATMGVMPDYSFEGKGMRIDGVTEGKPAFKAGMLAGDVVIKVGETTVGNMMDYMKALSKINPGDLVPVIVNRDGEEKTIMVQL